MSGATHPIDLVGPDRERAVPVLKAGFVGIYRWHAKRTLRAVARVRAIEQDRRVVAVALLERLVPEAGYVYYLAVDPDHRRRGLGGRLLDDALERFREEGAAIVYGAVEVDNRPSRGLFTSRGFREVRDDEPNYRNGGLGAWGLRRRMWIVPGEVLYGRFLSSGPARRREPEPP